MDIYKTIVSTFKEVYVYEIYLQNEMQVQTLIQVRKIKNEFSIKSQNPEIIKKNIPIVLCICGKSVITKIEKDKNSLLHFRKNVNLNEFFFQDYEISNFHAFSAIRYSLIDDVIQNLRINPEQISAVYPGALQINQFLTGFKIQDGNLSIGNHAFQVAEQIISYQFKSDESGKNQLLSIFNEDIEEKNAIAYLSGIDFLMKGRRSTFNCVGKFSENYSSLLFKQNTHNVLKIALPGLCILLIINSILSFYINKKTNDRNLREQNFIPILEKNKALKIENEKIRSSVQIELFARSHSIAFMIDQMMGIKPPSITLEELSFFPLSDQKSKNPDFDQREIIMAGLAQNHLDVKNWVVVLKQKEWIKNATIDSYKKQRRSSKNEFKIKIEI